MYISTGDKLSVGDKPAPQEAIASKAGASEIPWPFILILLCAKDEVANRLSEYDKNRWQRKVLLFLLLVRSFMTCSIFQRYHHEDSEMKECTFRPNLSKGKGKNQCQNSNNKPQNVFERLHHEVRESVLDD